MNKPFINQNKKIAVLFLFLFLPQLLFFTYSQEKCKEVIGYYPAWRMYTRAGATKPENLDYSKYTILNYSFFNMDSLGNLFGGDAWADSVLLRGEIDWGKPQPAYFINTSLIDQAHVWGVKVMPSIGGWSYSENFSEIAAYPERRARFASQCVFLLKNFKFDGIDIDWEFPNYAEHKGQPRDTANFTLLMKAIRDSIDAYGRQINYKFLLTAAFGSNESQMVNIQWGKVKDILDYLNMMTYDFNGTWSDEANHNSPLYAPAKGSKECFDKCFKLLTERWKVPAEKINMGIGYYGRTFVCTGKPELFAPHTKKADDKIFAFDEGTPQYFNIVYNMDKFEKKWDDIAKVPYLVGIDNNTFVSYDDEESIKLKAEYVLNKNAAGVIIWDVTGDYVEKKPGSGKISSIPLSETVNSVFGSCHKRTIKKRWN